MSILERILAQKRQELAALRAMKLPPAPRARPFSLKRAPEQPLSIVAEIKLRSPSAGALSTHLSVAQRAAAYARSGAAAISVLCDSKFFDGGYPHLLEARSACDLPLLCKEFVIDECQLDVARAHGADAVLLIARYLEDSALARLHAAALDRGLTPLVEVATEADARRSLSIGARTIGINARDLDTLVMDAALAEGILALIPSHLERIYLSGLQTAADVRRVSHLGADAALVGETLMRQDDPEPLLSSLVAAAG